MMFYKEMDFKETTVIGKIPMSWEMVRIQDICEFRRGFSYRSDQITEDATSTRFITINDYEKEGGFKHNNERLYLRDEVGPASDFILNQDDVLIANTDMSRGFIIGAPIHIESVEGKLIYSMDLTKLIFDAKKVNGKFLFYLLKHEKVRRKMKTFAQGTNVLHLNHELVKTLQVPLPSLSEQRVIVGVLGVVDLAVARAGEVIAKTERLKKGLMQTLLTRGIGHKEYEQTSIGTTPKTWQIVKIGDIAETSSGGTPSRNKKEYFKGNIPWVKSGELKDNTIYDTEEKITEEGLQNSAAKIFPKGTLLIAMYGATVGKTAILGIDATTNQAICAILTKDDTFNPKFLRYYIVFRREQMIAISAGGAQPNVSQEIIRMTKVALPPLQEQRKITEILSTLDKKLELEGAEKMRFGRVKQGLMDLLLTGKIRVKAD
jgi:type I restriction enzyme S subunit